MIINNIYRLYGRSKGRGKTNKITENAKKILLNKNDLNRINIIDIGAGYGESTIEIANINKNKNIIVCEKFIDGINRIAEDSLKNNLDNIKIFHGNVNQFLDEYCLHESISEIYIFFPDPWPKKRHHKRRLINEIFLKKIKIYLERGALIHIASDSKTYISE